MTITQAIDKINILQDKHGSAYFEETEIASLLDMAQNERLNRLFPDDAGGVVNFEQDENVFSNIRSLVHYMPLSSNFSVTVTGKGTLLSYSAIATKLNTLIGTTNGSHAVFRILNVDHNGNPVKYVKHNNLLSIKTNPFKEPSTTNPKYTLTKDGILLFPSTLAGNQLEITLIREPYKFSTIYNISSGGDSHPDWDDYNMNLIIMIALQLAGISTRDEELLLDIRNTQTTK